MMNCSASHWASSESRLIYRGDLGQLWEDTKYRHARADGALQAAGAPILTVGAGVTKIGNAVAGVFSSEAARPLPDGGIAYIRSDVGSTIRNLGAAAGNLVTFHPFSAAGNILKAGFDAVDIITVDPLLDVGAGIFGHQHDVRHSAQFTLAA